MKPIHRPVASIAASLAAALVATALLAACADQSDGTAAARKEGAADPLARLEITEARAEAAGDVPVATVPGQITLPPEARVAVTSPYPGAAVRVFVIEGQSVRRGQPLALVRAAEPVQIRGDLARANAELAHADARAGRLAQLASEGIIAGARADEARAAALQARASVTEKQRLASLAGAGADGTMTLRAPIGGRVSHVAITTGGPVDLMTAPFVIENIGAYQIDLQLPERMANAVSPGMAVAIAVPGPAGGKPVEAAGRILSVSPSIDPQSRSVMAKAAIVAAPGIVAGRNVSVTISAAPGAGGGVSVPATAVTRVNGADHVFVKTGKAYKPRAVAVVSRSAGRAIVAEGLKAGEVVATSSIAELKAMAAE